MNWMKSWGIVRSDTGWPMFGWNTFGILLMGPAVATGRFFSTLNKIEQKLNQED